jgi:hypothetical protein
MKVIFFGFLMVGLMGFAPRPARATEPSIKIISFQNEFVQFWREAKAKPFSQQLQLWNLMIEEPHRQFFDFAVWEKRIRPNWSETKALALKSRLALYPDLYGPTLKAYETFPQVVQDQIERFRKIVPDFESNFPIYAIVAPNFDAKSAVTGPRENSIALVIALDSIALEKANLDILFPHELFHAFHAQRSGFLNDGVMPGTSILVPLWEEGFATYVSGLANPGTTDGQLLFDPSFGKATEKDLRWLAGKFLEQMNQKTLDPSSTDAFKSWFSVGKLKVREDLPNRAGYFLGLRVVREVAKIHSLKEMIAWRPESVTPFLTDALAKLRDGT